MNYSLNGDWIDYVVEKAKYWILPSESNNHKSRLLQSNALLYCVILLLALKVITIFVTINIPQNIFFADITKSSLENFVNQTRESLGMQPLTENEQLNQAARLKAENMIQNQYFDHTSPSGISPWHWFKSAGYNYKYAGENLAIGFYESEEVYNAWLNSPSHKENIVNPKYTEVGTAVVSGFGGTNTIIVVQEFGTQLVAKSTTASQTTTNNNPVVTPAPTASVQTPISNPVQNVQNTANEDDGNQDDAVSNEQVLPQTTETKGAMTTSTGESIANLYSKLINSVLYNHDKLLQNTVYGVSAIVIGILLTLILFNFNLDFKKELVFRAVLIIVLLSAATLLDKEILLAIIPHQIII